MKEFIDKLIERLEEKKKEYLEGFRTHKENELYGVACGYGDSIKIVNELAEEFGTDINVVSKSGWIPCSSGYFSTSEVLVCKEDGTIDFDVYDFMDNDWKFNSNHHKNKVIAWQPLPAPYTEGE